jgi:hypothetical protein
MTKTGRAPILGICLILLGPLSAQAEKNGADPRKTSIPQVSSPPRIDGVLDESVWEEALQIEDFLQLSPVERGYPTHRTIAYLGYDRKNLYIAFRCYDSDFNRIRASVTQRDNIMEDDWVILFLDTFNEKRRAFAFILNPYGIQLDAIRMEQGGNDNMDSSWDTVFRSDGRIDESGYAVEIAIPFKSLRFPDDEKKTWGVTLGRSIARSGEVVIWPEFSREITGLLAQNQELMILGEVEKGKNFELMPILTSLKTQDEKVDIQPGLNFKWGLSSNHTLDMTVNPDYSQIEADAPQIDVNQRFALYYPEKRPFFLEGMEIFRFPEIQAVYTRRIIDPIAGAKLTGKLGRFTYGLLSSLDMNPTESLWDVSNGNGNNDINALFNIFRMKTDVFRESYVGLVLTDKQLTGGDFNRLVGVDGQFKYRQNLFFNFQALASQTRYEGSETGYSPAFYGNLGYYTKYWGGGLEGNSIHPDFEASSGYVNRVDYKDVIGYAFFTLYPEKQYLNQIRFQINAGRRYAFHENILLDQWLNPRINLRLTEFSMINLSYRRSLERYSDIDFHKDRVELNANLMMIGWLPFGLFLSTGDRVNYDPDDPFLGYSNVYGLRVTLKPNKRLRYTLSFTKETFWEEWGGKEIYDFNVFRNRLTYQLSKTLSLRAIVDYNHFYEEIYGSFLISYIYRPGTVFFLGIDNNLIQDDLNRYSRSDYSVFLKFSYWHRF